VELPSSYDAFSGATTRGEEGKATGAEAPWWRSFDDPALDRELERVLAGNLDLSLAAERVLEVAGLFRQVRALGIPTLSGGAQYQKSQFGVTRYGPSLPGGKGAFTLETYDLSLAASFELDVWGRLSRASEAARAELLRAEAARAVVLRTVLAEAATLYFRGVTLERRLEIARRRIAALEASLVLIEGRYQRGLASVLDLRQARRALAQARALVPGLEAEWRRNRQALGVLAGGYPSAGEPRPAVHDPLAGLAPVPVGLPSELLARRPDVRAAMAAVMAANARVGEALAARFPAIRLTGQYGYSSTELESLLESGSRVWSWVAGLTEPLFSAGRLAAEQRVAESRYRQALLNYRKAVLAAFSEVEAALVTRREQWARHDELRRALSEAEGAQELAEERYRRGLVDYLRVLEAQQTRYQIEDELVLTELALLTNRVTLHRVLGDGWEGLSVSFSEGGE
jgi:multidrug efflux system outer membrane protein